MQMYMEWLSKAQWLKKRRGGCRSVELRFPGPAGAVVYGNDNRFRGKIAGSEGGAI